MKSNTYDKGMDLLEHNYRSNYPVDVRLALWEWIKRKFPTLADSVFTDAVNGLLDGTFAPKIGEIKTAMIGGAESSYRPPAEAIRCGECRKLFTPRTELEEDTECCSECARLFMTDEGRRKLKERRARILANISRMGEMTQVEPDEEFGS